jgi:Na+-driven multidrug efflux pump
MTSTNQQEPLNDNDHPLFLSYGFLWGMFIAYIIALSVAIYINIKNSFFVNDPGYIELATSLLGVFAMYTLFNAIFVYVT